MKTAKLARSYRIDDGKHFRLKDFDPADTGHLHSIDQAREQLQKDTARLEDLQSKLYAQDRWALLLIFQALDAAGKDGTIKHVMSGVNPEGCQVYSFKAPSETNCNMISCGAPRGICPSAAISASSTALITKRCWWCECTPKRSRTRCFHLRSSPKTSGRNVSKIFAASSATWHATAR